MHHVICKSILATDDSERMYEYVPRIFNDRLITMRAYIARIPSRFHRDHGPRGEQDRGTRPNVNQMVNRDEI